MARHDRAAFVEVRRRREVVHRGDAERAAFGRHAEAYEREVGRSSARAPDPRDRAGARHERGKQPRLVGDEHDVLRRAAEAEPAEGRRDHRLRGASAWRGPRAGVEREGAAGHAAASARGAVARARARRLAACAPAAQSDRGRGRAMGGAGPSGKHAEPARKRKTPARRRAARHLLERRG